VGVRTPPTIGGERERQPEPWQATLAGLFA
jgi:hypothetical protein